MVIFLVDPGWTAVQLWAPSGWIATGHYPLFVADCRGFGDS
jgi:hypothetical protein